MRARCISGVVSRALLTKRGRVEKLGIGSVSADRNALHPPVFCQHSRLRLSPDSRARKCKWGNDSVPIDRVSLVADYQADDAAAVFTRRSSIKMRTFTRARGRAFAVRQTGGGDGGCRRRRTLSGGHTQTASWSLAACDRCCRRRCRRCPSRTHSRRRQSFDAIK